MITQEQASYVTVRFEAMHCPCEVLLDTTDSALGAAQLAIAISEAQRIEEKYSRYHRGNSIDQINSSGEKKIKVDEETAALLDYAAECYALSEGLFDITTGVLRRLWHFDGTENVRSSIDSAALRACIGWDKISWERPFIQLPPGFEIDFGGIGKEYAADRILDLLVKRHRISTLVNLGGDIAAAGDRLWSVGIEDPTRPGHIVETVHLRQGALATSGITKRFTKVNGKILGHILDPKTGWPVDQAPQSVTVAAKTCTEAGFWSTLGMLQGSQAELFLADQHLEFWCYR